MRVDLGANMSADINLTEADYQGNCLNANDNEWGTYTYDLLVLEYAGTGPVWTQGEAMDWNFLKRYKDGYHLWVPEDLPAPNGDDDGHDVWAHVPEDGAAELRGYYCLESDYGNDAVQRGNDVQIQVVDSELSERGSSASGPVAVGLIGADYGTVDADENDKWDGLSLYTYQENDPAGMWRAIFMASDNGGVGSPKWRTHTPLRMLTANATSRQGWARYVYKYEEDDPLVGHAAVGATAPEGDGRGAWVFGWYPDGDKGEDPVPGLLKMRYVPPGEDPLKQEREHSQLYLAYELEATAGGSHSVWQKVRSDWVAEGTGPVAKFVSAFLNHTEADFKGTNDETARQWALYWRPGGNHYNCAHFTAMVCDLNPNQATWALLNPSCLAAHVESGHDNGWLFYLKGRYFENTGKWCDCEECMKRRALK